ncbi:Glycoside hydrolase, family 1 [Niveomyces insectorum RCEF 264]|uniref:Glycoside hydrolase, family 1 n=1 Tax=Niveomyces insectorum RCEF 264 TaxID=1081102 RepID=A0A167RXJ8_9HYPO|nr:Glycoside hydrolase, family 1 [Niveomyces insectorum RCEF 264]
MNITNPSGKSEEKPEGPSRTNGENADGVFYSSLVDQLLAHNITPVVFLYHWDVPRRSTTATDRFWTRPLRPRLIRAPWRPLQDMDHLHLRAPQRYAGPGHSRATNTATRTEPWRAVTPLSSRTPPSFSLRSKGPSSSC